MRPNANLCMLAAGESGESQARQARVVPRDAPVAGSSERSRLGVFLNRSSPKYRQFAQFACQAVLIYLPSLAVPYRLHGTLAAISAEIVRRNWLQRPRAPKRHDRLYEHHPQGSVPASRQQLVDLTAVECRSATSDSALGYHLETNAIERLQLNRPIDGGWLEAARVPWIPCDMQPCNEGPGQERLAAAAPVQEDLVHRLLDIPAQLGAETSWAGAERRRLSPRPPLAGAAPSAPASLRWLNSPVVAAAPTRAQAFLGGQPGPTAFRVVGEIRQPHADVIDRSLGRPL